MARTKARKTTAVIEFRCKDRTLLWTPFKVCLTSMETASILAASLTNSVYEFRAREVEVISEESALEQIAYLQREQEARRKREEKEAEYAAYAANIFSEG